MRRSKLLKVSVFCPHFKRPVAADKNLAIDRLVSCAESEACRTPAVPPSMTDGPSDHARPFPRGCPVFPQLAR